MNECSSQLAISNGCEEHQIRNGLSKKVENYRDRAFVRGVTSVPAETETFYSDTSAEE